MILSSIHQFHHFYPICFVLSLSLSHFFPETFGSKLLTLCPLPPTYFVHVYFLKPGTFSDTSVQLSQLMLIQGLFSLQSPPSCLLFKKEFRTNFDPFFKGHLPAFSSMKLPFFLALIIDKCFSESSLKTMEMFCYFLNFQPLALAFIDGSCLNPLFWRLPSGGFSIPMILIKGRG